MEALWIIIAAVIALLIGCVVTWLVMRGKNTTEESQPVPIEPDGILSAEVKDLELKLKAAQDSKEQALSLKAALEDQIGVREKQISDLQKQLVQKETEVRGLTSKLDGFKNRLVQKENDLKGLTSKIDELSTLPTDAKEGLLLIDSLKSEVKKRISEIGSKEEEIERLKNEITSIEMELVSSKSEVEDLTIKIGKSEESAKKLEKDLHNVESELKKKSEEIDAKEEEIEELEDEIASTKKKLKSSKNEIEDLTTKLEKSDKKAKNLENDLRGVESELSELKDEDKVKSEAIDFVNAVLQAKEADDTDAKTIDEKVGKIKSIVFDQFIPLQKHYFKDVDNIGNWIKNVENVTLHWTNLQRKSWLKRKKVIAFIGEFSAGKTSIVNRILSQDDPDCPRLPVSSKATTAIATYISYGEGFNSQFTDVNGDLKNLPPEMFMKVNKDILAKVNVSSIIQYFVMKYRNENLRGLSILDTPGFSSNDAQDKDRTLAVINEADALFWVVDANSGEVNRTSLKIIAESVQDIPLYIVINKADTKSPAELSRLEKHIKQTMSRAEINVSGYVRFSQKAPLSDIMKVIESLPDARTGLDIGVICLDLKRDLNNLQNDLKVYKDNIRQLESLLKNREEILEEDIRDIGEACGRIASIPQHNTRFFSKDDYRMDQEEYQELVGLCEDAGGFSDQVKDCFDDYKDFIKDYHHQLEERDKTKEHFNDTQKIHKLLMDAIKSLDPKLHQEVEQAVKATLEEERKEKADSYTSSSTNNRQTYTTPNTSNSSSNSGASLTAGQELEKADWFYSRHQIEEAKFWYRASAKHGNEEAKEMCRRLNISY